MTTEPEPSLDAAYALETPADNIELYQRWSATYDDEFAGGMGYVYPLKLAEVFCIECSEDDQPILDVGAGTGLVAEALQGKAVAAIDALDISAEMLAVAESKKLYQQHIQANLCETLPIESNSYGAIVSAGTFTHGHVGPKALRELIRIAEPGALFCLGINGEIFDSAGFGSELAHLSSEGLIGPAHYHRVSFYEEGDSQHAGDHGFIAVFRSL